jgi:hypothetical protein
MRYALVAFALLLAACTNPRRDAEVSTPPASAQAAALALNAELSEHGVHVRGVSASTLELYWESDYSGEASPAVKGEQAWVGNTLTYEEIQNVSAPEHDALGWRLLIAARGGKVRLWLNDRDSGLRVRAALSKLANP